MRYFTKYAVRLGRLLTPRNASFVFCAIVLLAASFSPASTFQFKSPTTISTGTTKPTGFAVGDFNGDGKPDLAIPDMYGKTVTIFLNAGGGTFGAPIVTTLNIDNTLGQTPLAADLNEDGHDQCVGDTEWSYCNSQRHRIAYG